MNIFRRNIPNLITCVNVLAGCVAIIFAFDPHTRFEALEGWQCAALAVAVGAVADFFDGFAARMLKSWSEIGKELDSLSDLVSFGVAPAMIVFNLLEGIPGSPVWLPWCTLMIPVGGAVRLARFNVDTRQTTSFIGLPIPANAIFWIGYAAIINVGSCPQWLVFPWVAVPLIACVSYLMLAPIPLFSLKFHNYGWSDNRPRWILIAGAAILLTVFGLRSLVPIILLYLLLSAFSRRGK